MKKKLVLTELALRDLTDIYDFIAEQNPKSARAFLADLTERIEWIADVGFSGAPRDHIRAGLRAFPYRNRCIYFLDEADRIVVLRVIHGARDIDAVDF